MPLKNANPAPSWRTGGARKNDQAGSSIYSENKLPPLPWQVARLLRRFNWSEARARVVAELAFNSGRAA
jgi:hypothetical protein